MPEIEFVSTYNGINYRIPESDKHAKFNEGRLVTNDDEVISHLRNHPDYGVTLTEIGRLDRKSVTVDVCICDMCGKVFRSKRALQGHKLSCKSREGESADEDRD